MTDRAKRNLILISITSILIFTALLTAIKYGDRAVDMTVENPVTKHSYFNVNWHRYLGLKPAAPTAEEQRNKMAENWVKRKYGLEVEVTRHCSPDDFNSLFFAGILDVHEKDEADPEKYFKVWFKTFSWKICDEYYLYKKQEKITEAVKGSLSDLPVECVITTHTHHNDTCPPMQKQKRLFKNHLADFLDSVGVETDVYIYCKELPYDDDYLKAYLKPRLDYIYRGDVYFFICDDLENIDYSLYSTDFNGNYERRIGLPVFISTAKN